MHGFMHHHWEGQTMDGSGRSYILLHTYTSGEGYCHLQNKEKPINTRFFFLLNLPLSFSTITFFFLISLDPLLSIYYKQGLLWVDGGWWCNHKEEKSKGKLLCYSWWWSRAANEGSRLVLLRAHKFVDEWGC